MNYQPSGEVEYRDIQGHPGYRIGNDGSVWSCWKRRGPNKGSEMALPWKQLKLGTAGTCGHKVICLKGSVYKLVHRLVLEAFVGPCPEGMVCLHRNGDATDNRVENLRWGTMKENTEDCKNHGRLKLKRANPGSRHHNAKLTESQVIEIDKALRNGAKPKDLAAQYEVSVLNIRAIKNGYSWANVTGRSSSREKYYVRSQRGTEG